jgi:hypothetical protein
MVNSNNSLHQQEQGDAGVIADDFTTPPLLTKASLGGTLPSRYPRLEWCSCESRESLCSDAGLQRQLPVRNYPSPFPYVTPFESTPLTHDEGTTDLSHNIICGKASSDFSYTLMYLRGQRT